MNSETYRKLAQECPEAVMVRVVLEDALTAELADEVFEEHREKQFTRTLLFSTVVGLLQLVVCRIRPSVHAAFKLLKAGIEVSAKSLYNKLNCTETAVSEALVREAGRRMRQVVDELGCHAPQLVRGFDTRIVDGNHLAATHHRIKELRRIGGGPLPGKSLVVWDAERGLVHNVYCCEDGHAQERRILPALLDDVQPGELWIGDRNFATALFVWQVRASKACFLVRRHARNIRLQAVGRERRVGETETGVVYEQAILIEDDFGGEFSARKIRVALHTATRDGDRDIELLSNLPGRVSGVKIAETYRQRWRIETAFFELDQLFEGEVESLGHPRAALLMFCLSLIAYNALGVARAALAAAHGREQVNEMSAYYFAHLVNSDWRALEIIASCSDWKRRFGNCSPKQIARELKSLAKKVDITRIKKSKRGPKTKPPKRTSHKRKPHVSTARVLQARRQAK